MKWYQTGRQLLITHAPVCVKFTSSNSLHSFTSLHHAIFVCWIVVCFYWTEECEPVSSSGFTNVNILFLICLMFIFKRRIQILLFRIHLVSITKCVTCQVSFWINYWRVWIDKQPKHSLRYPAVFQKYLSRVQCSKSYAN